MSDQANRARDNLHICDMVKNAGIVGAGGAGFPTHAKLSAKADIVIANGAECEPILETDRHLLLNEAGKVIEGLKLAMQACGASRGIIAIKRKHKDISTILTELLKDESSVDLLLLDNFYPAGDEHVLVYEAAGRIVPMGGIPLDAGVVVDNVYTLALIADAIHGKSFTHRYVTITGEVNRPCVAKLPIGMSIGEAINKIAKGTSINRFKVIIGGPMMGKVENDLETPITKTTSGIIVLPESHRVVSMKTASLETSVRIAKSACCQCSFCTEMCPRFLLGHKLMPHRMMRLLPLREEGLDMESVYSASLCSECGLCGAYSCTMGLAPNRVNGLLKGVLSKNGIKPDYKNKKMDEVHEFREYRKVPTDRLIGRLDFVGYDRHLPYIDEGTKPERVILPLKQHIGIPAIPVVNPGDRVECGHMVAKTPEKGLSASFHSPVDGIVREVSQSIVIETFPLL